MQQPRSWRPFLCLIAEEQWLTESCRPIQQDVARTLFIHAVFGGNFFISDSFLLSHSEAAKMLTDGSSLLRKMLSCNYAVIVTTAVSRHEFMAPAQGHSIQGLWMETICRLWPERIRRLPRDAQEIGFKVARVSRDFEFRKARDFEKLTERDPKRTRDRRLKTRREALALQIGSYAANGALDFLSEAPGRSFSPVSGTTRAPDVITAEFRGNTVLDQPFIFVRKDFLQTGLSRLNWTPDPSREKFRDRKENYSRQLLRVIRAGNPDATKDLAAITNKYLAHLDKEIPGPGVADIIRTDGPEAGDWISLTVREVLPAVISCTSRIERRQHLKR